MTNFCVSLTTIPPRYKSIKKTLESLKKQTIKANKIFLNIPHKFKRFDNLDVDIKDLENSYDNLEIIRCNDYGPGTKLLGSLQQILKFDYVVLVDDDHIYQKNMFELFNQEAFKNKEKSYSFSVSDILDCKVGQGADGFLIKTVNLNNILNFFNNYVKNNQSLFYNDDLWISIYLNKVLKVEIESLFYLIKKSFFFKKKSIYKKHTKIEALIETYSKDRKEARRLRYEENCKEYLLIKEKTKNFTNI